MKSRIQATHFFVFMLIGIMVMCSCRQDRVRNKFAGAWDIEKITITEYKDGVPHHDSIYLNPGVWSFVDNGSSGYTYNRSYLSLKNYVPCIFESSLQYSDGRYSGLINWGSDFESTKRILIATSSNSDGTEFNVEKINRRKFIFYYFTQDPNNADDIKQMQRFELKRTNQ